MTGLLAAIREIREQGSFGYANNSMTTPELVTYRAT
jgi:hypothetical protein